MRHCVWTLMVMLALTLACSPPDRNVESNARAITVDGNFTDWEGMDPVIIDSRGETAPGSPDFGSLWLANDQHALYLRLEVGRETIWQNDADQTAGNDIRIFLDTDSDAATGKPFELLGTDYEIHLGNKLALLHDVDGTRMISLNQSGLTVGPSHSASEFEVRIPFDLDPDSTDPKRIISGPKLRLLIQDASGGDRLPDAGVVPCVIARKKVPPVEPLSLDRNDTSDLRVLSHNIQYNRPIDDPGPFRRYLRALQPDVINLQEVWIWDAEETRGFVADALDSGTRESWYVAKVEDCVTVSRWPIYETAAVDGNLVCRIDLPEDLSSTDLVIFNAHTPCCGRNDGRDYEHDHMAATWRDLLTGEGPFPIEGEDSVVLLGDFNMVGFVRQLVSLRDGDIYDNDLFGPDFQPDVQEGSLSIAPLRHTHSRAVYSWRNDLERYPPGRLDYILYGSGRASLKNNFILNTAEIPQDVLEKHDLRSADSQVSDHLVLVADFAFR